MRKTIKRSDPELAPEKASCLDVSTIAQVEVTSEDAQYPIESALQKETSADGGLLSEESRPSGFFSMSRNGSDVSGSIL